MKTWIRGRICDLTECVKRERNQWIIWLNIDWKLTVNCTLLINIRYPVSEEFQPGSLRCNFFCLLLFFLFSQHSQTWNSSFIYTFAQFQCSRAVISYECNNDIFDWWFKKFRVYLHSAHWKAWNEGKDEIESDRVLHEINQPIKDTISL